MTNNYRTFRTSLNSDPLKREEVFQYHFSLGRYGGMSEDDARLNFEYTFTNNPRSMEPLITTYFATNPQISSNTGNSNSSEKKISPNQRKLEKSLILLGGSVLGAGLSQLTDVEATKVILETTSGAAALAGAVGSVIFGLKKRYE